MNHVKGTRKVVLAKEQINKDADIWLLGEGAIRHVWGADHFQGGEYAFILTKDSAGNYGTLQIAHGEVRAGSRAKGAKSVRLITKRL